MTSALYPISREVQLEEALEKALKQIELCEQFKKVLENDVQRRDDVIASQERLIQIMKDQIGSIMTMPLPVVVMPPHRFFGVW